MFKYITNESPHWWAEPLMLITSCFYIVRFVFRGVFSSWHEIIGHKKTWFTRLKGNVLDTNSVPSLSESKVSLRICFLTYHKWLLAATKPLSRASLSGTHDVCCSLLSTWRIVLSTPLAVLCYFLIFCVPPFEDGKVVWYLFFYCAFQTLQTVSVPPLDPETFFL